MRLLITLILACVPVFGASITCQAVKSGNASDPTVWKDGANPANPCQALGGASISFEGSTQMLLAGVPGAAGSKDCVTVPDPFLVTGDVNLEFGDPSSSASCAGLTLGATSSSSFARIVMTAGHALSLRGYGSVEGLNPLGSMSPWSVLQIQPGAALWFDTANPEQGELRINGRVYIGCHNSLVVLGCNGPTGAWVQFNSGTPGTVSAWAGGTGLYAPLNNQTLPTFAVGDIVEFLVAPLPAATGTGALGPPYTLTPCVYVPDPVLGFSVPSYCGIPPSIPAPGVMPVTTDSAMCGGAASCVVPHGVPLCVVQASPLQVGYAAWATDGPHCSGSTAIAITDSGTAPLWMIKPAFVSQNPANYTWNASASDAPSAFQSYFDAIRTHYLLPYSNVSNAAGNGPARKGDTSLSFSGVTVTSQLGAGATANALTQADRCPALTAIGQFTFDPVFGEMCLWGGSNQVSWTANFKHLAIANRAPKIRNSVAGAGTELLIENSDVRGLYSTAAAAVVDLTGYNSATANNRLRMEGSLLAWSATAFQLDGLTGSANSPIPVWEGGEIQGVSESANYVFVPYSSSAHVSISNNWLQFGRNQFAIGTYHAALTGNTPVDHPHWYLVGNAGYVCDFIDIPSYGITTFSDALISRFRFESPAYAGQGFITVGGTNGHPATAEWGVAHGFRMISSYDQYFQYRYFHIPFSGYHHTFVANEGSSAVPLSLPSVSWDHIIQAAGQSNSSSETVDFGYQAYAYIQSPRVTNITTIGAQIGCVGLQDAGDDEISVVLDASVANNICQGAASTVHHFARGVFPVTNYIGNVQLTSGLNNAMYGTAGGNYTQNATPPPNQNTTTLNRFSTITWHSGTNYNTDATRTVAGVTLQNSTAASVASGSLVFTRTSASNMTYTWNDGGGAGAAQQLNWAGSGTSYTATAVTVPYTQANNGTIAVSGTPWDCGTTGPTDANAKQYYSVGCPAGNLLKWTSGAAAGTVSAILGGTRNTLIVSPTPGGAIADTFVILKVNLILPNSGATQSIEVGVSAALLPASSVTDSGITVSTSGICASGCPATGDPAIPQTWTWDVTNAPANGGINSPLEGPDPTVQAFAPNGPYVPQGNAWKTQSTSGSYIGAVNGLISSSLTGPTAGTTGIPSTVFTYSLTSGVFSGGTIVTCSDGGQNGQFVSGAGNGTGSISVTPSLNATSFTFTYTATSPGAKSISCSTALGYWTDPGAKTYTASGSAATYILLGSLRRPRQ